MIVEFSVGNFRSFKDIQTLSMLAASSPASGTESDDSRVISAPHKVGLLKSKAIYGANASGKSNVIKAVFAFLRIVRDSLKDEQVLKKTIQPFLLSTETEHQSSFFQIIFIVDDVQYRYGFEATTEKITAEWLLAKSLAKERTREVQLFVREHQEITANEKRFREGRVLLRSENDLVRDNALFITVVTAFTKTSISRLVVDYITRIGVIFGDRTEDLHGYASGLLEREDIASQMLFITQVADRGIREVNHKEYEKRELPTNILLQPELEEMTEKDKAYLITTKHKKFDARNQAIGDVELTLVDNGSNGTKKMFELSPILLLTIQQKHVLFIDEIDARLHPRLTRKVIESFHSFANHAAQLIFVTHDSTLLSGNLLRHEQISFAEKDEFGATSLYALAEFKGVRKNTLVDKEYMRGSYGAVPFVGDFPMVLNKEGNA